MANKLPKGWAVCLLNDICKIQNGYAFPSKDFKVRGDIPLIKQTQLNGLEVSIEKCVYLDKNYLSSKKEFILKKGDLLIGMSGSIGKICKYNLNTPALQNQRTGKFILHTDTFLSKSFLWHFLTTIENQLKDKGKGLGVLNVSANDIEKLTFYLPPLSEQKRIADKLDKLMARVESATNRLEKIPILLKRFRQSVLTSFFSSDNELHEIKDVCDLIQIGPFGTQLHRSDYIANGIPVINPTHIVNRFLVPDKKLTISKEKYNSLSNYHLNADDIIMGRRGEMARCALIDSKSDGWLCGTGSLFFRPNKKKILSKYLFYSLVSTNTKSFLENESLGSTMDNLNLRIAKSIPISVPKLEKQKNIVNTVERLLINADKLEERYKKAKAYTDKLKQSLLAKAFRGELVKQDPKDEPASELLEKIKNEKEKSKDKKSLNIYEMPLPSEIEDNYYYKRMVLASYIVNQSLKDNKFGDTKFEKILHLAEYWAVKRNFKQRYYKKTAGPYDNAFTKGFFAYIEKNKWFVRHKQDKLELFKPGVNNHKSDTNITYFTKEQLKNVDKLINYFRKADYKKPEIISTLYAVWNNRIILNQVINDEALIKDFYAWHPHKSEFKKDRLKLALNWMREENIVPDGWGSLIEKSGIKTKKS